MDGYDKRNYILNRYLRNMRTTFGHKPDARNDLPAESLHAQNEGRALRYLRRLRRILEIAGDFFIWGVAITALLYSISSWF